MRTSRFLRPNALTVAATIIATVTSPVVAQVAPKGTGFRAEYLAELSVAEDHLVRLAEAIPAEKYTWRPAPGVRSISEVLLHIAGSHFNLPRVLGVAPREGMVGPDYARSTTDKAAVVAALKESFAFTRSGIEKLTDAEADVQAPVPQA
jgi:hypothetical protein